MPGAVNNFTVIESVYGRFVVNRHCAFQADALIKTGLPHIESELRMILAIAGTLPEGARAGRAKVPPLDYGSAQDFGLLSLVGSDPSGAGEEIGVTAIDSMPLPRLDFLKIDVEGMEIEVLEGAAASLRAHRPWCWVEYWKVGTGPIKDAFKGLPYRFYQVDQLNLLCAPTERLAAAKLSIDAPEV